MAQALGNPSVDPHGDPIPAPDGTIVEVIYTPLTELAAGTRAEVKRVDSSDAERLRYLASVGLKPGAVVRVTERHPFSGPVTVETQVGPQVVGHELGSLVLCLPRSGVDG